MHDITRLALDDFSLDGRRLRFLSAYSGKEALEMLESHPDTAIILLDVVMEKEHSGLEMVRVIREEMKNSHVRIILRTGHPGQAPEREVIGKYDINDYKEKTELTAQKLFTSVMAALRSYRDIQIIDRNRRGLEQIIDASADLFKQQSLGKFATGALTLLTSLLHLDDSSLYVRTTGLAASCKEGSYRVIAASGRYSDCLDEGSIPEEIVRDLRQACRDRKSFFSPDRYVGYFQSNNGFENILYLKPHRPLTHVDKNLISIFSTNVATALDNIHLNREIVETQKEVVTTLGAVIDSRSKETANHVLRVGEYARSLGLFMGLPESQLEVLSLAAPMHDAGKIGIPDAVLLKPGRLSTDEFEIMKTHTLIGYDILKGSGREIMRAAADIALTHHERWNGGGYPRGLRAEEIPLYGRITGIADVFDALNRNRVYKKAWPRQKLLDFFHRERGGLFDPDLVDLFLDHTDELFAIYKAYPDRDIYRGNEDAEPFREVTP